MKSKNYHQFVTLILLLTFSYLANSQETQWYKNYEYQGIEFNKVRFVIHENDTIYASGFLVKTTFIEGYYCFKYVSFKKGGLVEFNLADDAIILGHKIPKHSQVRIYKDKIHFFFGVNTQIQGFCCSGNFEKWYSTGISTSLYKNGKLKFFYPCTDIIVDDIPCKASPFAGIGLHENGHLKSCQLSQDAIIKGLFYEKNTKLEFDKEGNVIKYD